MSKHDQKILFVKDIKVKTKSFSMNSYIYENHNSKSFYSMAWIGFAISFFGMAMGIYYLEADLSSKGFLLMSYLFSVTACFTVAKVVRDKHEENQLVKST